MANRLSKIYTRTGDDGSTGLADGQRVQKNSLLIHAMGEVDELNSSLAVLYYKVDAQWQVAIRQIQHTLFDAGAELAMQQAILTQANIDWLEQALDSLNETLSPLQEFILPGGGETSAQCHLARSVCRRLERTLVACAQDNALNPFLLGYINRLSDYLFVLARAICKQAGEEEVYWQSAISRCGPETGK